jgi:hypothetical protein
MLNITLKTNKLLKYQFLKGISLNDINLLKQELHTTYNVTLESIDKIIDKIEHKVTTKDNDNTYGFEYKD